MSDENGNNKLPIECVKCGQKFSTPFPAIEMSNNLRFSALVAVHNSLIYCPNSKCSQPYTIALVGQYQVAFAAQPVNDAAIEVMEGSKIVKPHLMIVPE